MKRGQIIYYTDEQNDEFSTARITPRRIDENYRYLRTAPIGKIGHFFWYRIVAAPLAFLYTKIVLRHKIIGKEKLRHHKKNGYFIYANHTQAVGDALMPHMLDPLRDKYVIVHPSNVSMPLLGKITPYLGALPLPDTLGAAKNFSLALGQRVSEKRGIVIYPEAHIWPYYTKIRPFGDASFQYPVKYGRPSFTFTNTYQKRRFSKKPRILTYINGPFYPNTALSPREQRRELRDRIYLAMCNDAEKSTVVYIEYQKKEAFDK